LTGDKKTGLDGRFFCVWGLGAWVTGSFFDK
jgi:hypothetical protein